MARNIRRYPMTLQIPGFQFGSSRAIRIVRQLIKSGKLPFREMSLRESERLDILAGQEYGNTRLWWVIAAASDIGWGLQCPPGTYLRIPKDLGIIKDAL
jgi:hypothetical protein